MTIWLWKSGFCFVGLEWRSAGKEMSHCRLDPGTEEKLPPPFWRLSESSAYGPQLGQSSSDLRIAPVCLRDTNPRARPLEICCSASHFLTVPSEVLFTGVWSPSVSAVSSRKPYFQVLGHASVVQKAVEERLLIPMHAKIRCASRVSCTFEQICMRLSRV